MEDLGHARINHVKLHRWKSEGERGRAAFVSCYILVTLNDEIINYIPRIVFLVVEMGVGLIF